jgi:hypothetical protein
MESYRKAFVEAIESNPTNKKVEVWKIAVASTTKFINEKISVSDFPDIWEIIRDAGRSINPSLSRVC